MYMYYANIYAVANKTNKEGYMHHNHRGYQK